MNSKSERIIQKLEERLRWARTAAEIAPLRTSDRVVWLETMRGMVAAGAPLQLLAATGGITRQRLTLVLGRFTAAPGPVDGDDTGEVLDGVVPVGDEPELVGAGAGVVTGSGDGFWYPRAV